MLKFNLTREGHGKGAFLCQMFNRSLSGREPLSSEGARDERECDKAFCLRALGSLSTEAAQERACVKLIPRH